MDDFKSLFPNFAARSADLKAVLMPIAYLLLVTGMVSATITGRRSAGASMKTMGRTMVYIILLTHLVSWGNEICLVTDATVKNVLKADPTQVYQQYNQALQAKKSTTGQTGWWEKLFNVGTSIFEALISALLWVFGLLASVIVFYAYLIQKFILYLGYALSPIFIGFLAIRSLNSIGFTYLLGLAGVMIWPLGWGAASLVTEGLLNFMTDQSFIASSSLGGAAGYAFQNFIGVAVLGVWLIFSTIAAPLIIQRAISSGIQVGSALISGATTAATTAIASGATAAATFGAAGGVAGAAAGVTAGVAATGIAMIGSSLSGSTYSPTGSLVTALGQMRGSSASSKKQDGEESASNPQPPSPTDMSGDNAVQALLRKIKNPNS